MHVPSNSVFVVIASYHPITMLLMAEMIKKLSVSVHVTLYFWFRRFILHV